MKAIVESTLTASLWVQWITLFINLFALSLPIPDVSALLQSILTVETIVQVIQLTFYTWYSFQIHLIADITRHRYADWVITTPLMLFTTMAYYEYRNTSEKSFTLEDFWNRYWKEILTVGAFNLAMLAFGFLQELGRIGLVTSTVFGFAGLFGSFATIYTQFASQTPSNLPLFWFTAGIWSLYGVAAWFPTTSKNVAYNILDIFSKNAYGVFLSFLIYNLSTI